MQKQLGCTKVVPSMCVHSHGVIRHVTYNQLCIRESFGKSPKQLTNEVAS